MIASRNPKTLAELYRLEPRDDLRIALIVENEKDFSGLNHCPYSSVDITDGLATHDRIMKIHHSMKGVFVRVKCNKVTDEKSIKNMEKRIQWLKHERVDAIISNRTELLIKSVN
jgi:hypothetical protein